MWPKYREQMKHKRNCPVWSQLITATINTLSHSCTFLETEDEVDSYFHGTSRGEKLPCQRGCWKDETVPHVYSVFELKLRARKCALKPVL